MGGAGDGESRVCATWMCKLCAFVYSEADGWPEQGIAPGTSWNNVPADWLCPDCGADKSVFDEANA